MSENTENPQTQNPQPTNVQQNTANVQNSQPQEAKESVPAQPKKHAFATPRKYGYQPPKNMDSLKNLPHIGDLVSMPASLPPAASLADEMNKFVYDQKWNDCTANSIAKTVRYFSQDTLKPSRLFIYFCERLLNGDVNQDDGSTIATSIAAIRQFGAPPEDLWQYNQNNLFAEPSHDVFLAAKKDYCLDAVRVMGLDHIKLAIDNRFPVNFGFRVFSYMESQEMAQTGVLRLPQQGEEQLGGHAVDIIGYDDSRKAVLVANSWGGNPDGQPWGFEGSGNFWMPYEYVTNPNLVFDFWAVHNMAVNHEIVPRAPGASMENPQAATSPASPKFDGNLTPAYTPMDQRKHITL